MYDRKNSNDECFIIIKRPCGQRRENHCSFPPEIKFEDDNRSFDDKFDWDDQDFDWDDDFKQERFHKNNRPCRCNCNRPCHNQRQRRCCCFNFFRCC